MAMLSGYGARAMGALVLLGAVAGLVALLAATLLFQIRAEGGGRPGPGGLPESARGLLLPAATVLAALCLAISLSALLLSLLHGYCGAEQGAPPGGASLGPDRGEWFLVESRPVRHVAVGLFCCGVSAYLAALSMYTLVAFELEVGITSACILSSGVVVLVLTATHALIRASRTARGSQGEFSHTLYENDSACEAPAAAAAAATAHLNNARKVAPPRPRPEIHREFSYPPGAEQKSPDGTPAASNLGSSRSGDPAWEKESYGGPRMHCTLSPDSSLLRAHGKPWNGVTREMKNALSRKPVGSGKDSTLV